MYDQQPTKASRTRINGSINGQAPTEHTQVTSNPVPKFVSPMAGMDGLSQVFENFNASLQGGIDKLENAQLTDQRRGIQQENAAQKNAGTADALSGKQPDPTQNNDYDYYDAYRSTLANRTATDAAKEFNDWYLHTWAPANPTGDLTSARDQWAKDNLSGSQDKDMQGQVLSTFYAKTDQTVSSQTENAVKVQIATGKNNLAATIDGDAAGGAVTPDKIATYQQTYKTLDPLNPDNAAPWVAAQIGNSIANHPDQSNNILDTLTKPGTGVNGKSFAESFPDAYGKAQADATQALTQVHTVDELNTVNDLKDRLSTIDKGTEADVTQLNADVHWAIKKYGPLSALQSIRDQLSAANTKFAQKQAYVDGVSGMIQGTAQLDPDVVKKYLPDALHQMGIDNILTADPIKVATVFTKLNGVIPDQYREQISQALTSFENPTAQANAATLLKRLADGRDSEFAKSFLNETSKPFFANVLDALTNTNDPVETVIGRLDENRRDKPKPPTDAELTNLDPSKATKAIQDQIQSSINSTMAPGSGLFGTGLFGTNVKIPPKVMDQLMGQARTWMNERISQGVSPMKAVDEAVKAAQNNLEVIPQNGVPVVSFTAQRPNVTWDGKVPAERTRLGFGVINPITGRPVNTYDIYGNQLQQLFTKMPALFSNGRADDTSLVDSTAAASVGGFAVQHQGNPIILAPGEKITVGDGKPTVPDLGLVPSSPSVFTATGGLTLPGQNPTQPVKPLGGLTTVEIGKSVDEINGQLFKFLPQGFTFIPYPTSKGTVEFQLVYKPNFGDQAGVSIDQREKDFKELPPDEIIQLPEVNVPDNGPSVLPQVITPDGRRRSTAPRIVR